MGSEVKAKEKWECNKSWTGRAEAGKHGAFGPSVKVEEDERGIPKIPDPRGSQRDSCSCPPRAALKACDSC